MKRLLLSSVIMLALSGAAHAQNCCYATTTTCINCSNGVIYFSGSSVTADESTLASWAARKAVESQQSTWWETKKVKDLSREELDARTEKLAALKVWAKTLSNHIFATAYCDWADARLSAAG